MRMGKKRGLPMEVEVRIRETDLGEAIKSYAVRRARFALGRFSSRVGRVVIRITDVNGSRGGSDQCCQITAELVHESKVVVEQIDRDMFAAIDRACDRLGQAFRREIERIRDGRIGHESIRHAMR